MTEEKAPYSTAPANLNELKQRVEEGGTDWGEALAILKAGTRCKDIAAAIQEGWTVEDLWKVLQAVDREPGSSPSPETKQPTVSAEEDAEVEAMIKRDFGAEANPAPKAKPDPTPAPQNGQHFTEAPASFNVKAISPAGFDVMLTLRDDNSTRLMERVKGTLHWLATNSFTPTSARNSGGGNGPSANSDDGKQKYCAQKRDDPGYCPVHGKEMKRSQHHPGYYCPTRV